MKTYRACGAEVSACESETERKENSLFPCREGSQGIR